MRILKTLFGVLAFFTLWTLAENVNTLVPAPILETLGYALLATPALVWFVLAWKWIRK